MSQIGSISSSYGYGNMMGDMSGLSRKGVKQSLAALASESLSQIATSGAASISQTEFEQAFAQAASTSGASSTSTASSATTATADSIFKKIDANGDGKISADEWNSFQQKVEAHEGHGHHHHAQAIDSADSSTSTQSPAQTLQSLVAQLYKSADTNGNGLLSQGEVANWLTSGLISM